MSRSSSVWSALGRERLGKFVSMSEFLSVRPNLEVVNPLTDHPWGLRDFVVEIPGGHRLAFGERTTGG